MNSIHRHKFLHSSISTPLVFYICAGAAFIGGWVSWSRDPHLVFGGLIGIIFLGFVILRIKQIELSILVLAILLRSPAEAVREYELWGGLNGAGVIALIIIFLSFVLLILKNKMGVIFNYRTLPILLLLVWGSAPALLQSNNQHTTLTIFSEISRMLSTLSIFWMIVAFVRSEKTIYLIISTTLLSSLFPLAVGFINIFTGADRIKVFGLPSLSRIQSVFAHPNNYAHYLLIILVVTYIYSSNQQTRNIKKWIIIFIQVLLLVSLSLTFSRSAIVGALIVLLIIRSRSLNQLVGGGIFLIIITGLFAYLFPDFVDYTFTQTLVSNSSNVSTLASRFNIWQKALDIFGSRSFIGFGPGSFLASVGNNAHNDYLHVFFEYGAFGLVFFLIVEVFKVLDGLKLAAWQKKWEKVDRSLRRSAGTAHLNSSGFDILGLAFFALDVAFLAISLVGNTFNIPVLQWYSYALWGLVVARLRVLQPLESRTTVYKALNK